MKTIIISNTTKKQKIEYESLLVIVLCNNGIILPFVCLKDRYNDKYVYIWNDKLVKFVIKFYWS